LKAILILGSNLGNRKENLKRAEELIEKFCGKVLKRSSLLETAPFGVKNQPYFLNYGLLIETLHPPVELLKLLKWIEKRIGRFPTFRWGPRVVDIDIVLYEKVKLETPLLTVPHRGLKDRDFFKSIVKELLDESSLSFPYRF